MWRWLVRYGAIRVVGRRAVPVLMLWDAAVMANRVRQVPVVDRALRRGAAAAAERLADTLEGFTPSVGRPSPRSSTEETGRERERDSRGRPGRGNERGRR